MKKGRIRIPNTALNYTWSGSKNVSGQRRRKIFQINFLAECIPRSFGVSHLYLGAYVPGKYVYAFKNPKLFISDPDSGTENSEFWIRILTCTW